jgi:hypothetical protein
MPRQGFAPLAVRVRTTVERDDRNRSMCLIWSVDGFSNKSCQSDTNGHLVRIEEHVLILREEGTWDIAVVVTRSDGSAGRAHVSVVVIGRM